MKKSMLFSIGQPNDAFAQYFVGQSYLAPVSKEQVGIFNVTLSRGVVIIGISTTQRKAAVRFWSALPVEVFIRNGARHQSV